MLKQGHLSLITKPIVLPRDTKTKAIENAEITKNIRHLSK